MPGWFLPTGSAGEPQNKDWWALDLDNFKFKLLGPSLVTPLQTWAFEGYNLKAAAADAANDPNGDGWPLLYDYGLGLNPMTGLADGGALPQLTGCPVYIVAQRNDKTLSFKLRTTDDLVSGLWNTDNVGVEYTVSGANTVGSFNYVTYAIDTADSKKFIRVLVEQL